MKYKIKFQKKNQMGGGNGEVEYYDDGDDNNISSAMRMHHLQ